VEEEEAALNLAFLGLIRTFRIKYP